MPRLRMNLRDMNDLDELDLIDTVDQMSEDEERGGDRDDRRVVNPVALQRRQDSRDGSGGESLQRRQGLRP